MHNFQTAEDFLKPNGSKARLKLPADGSSSQILDLVHHARAVGPIKQKADVKEYFQKLIPD